MRCSTSSLESFVPDEHPLRRIRAPIDDKAIRKACRRLYSSSIDDRQRLPLRFEGSTGTGAVPCCTVNALMENRNRIRDRRGDLSFLPLLDRAKRRPRFAPTTLGADKGYFSERFIEAIFDRGIEPAHRHCGQWQPAHPRAGSHARARRRLQDLAAIPQEDRGAVRRGRRTGTECGDSEGGGRFAFAK